MAALISTAAAAAIGKFMGRAATSGGKLATAAPPENYQKPRPGLKCRRSSTNESVMKHYGSVQC